MTNIVVGQPIVLDMATIVIPPPNSGSYYLHTQTSPMATWTINHTLNRVPNVTIVGPNNFVIYTDIEYPSNNTVILTFSVPMTGRAILT